MITCPKCGKTFAKNSGYYGHKKIHNVVISYPNRESVDVSFQGVPHE